MAASGGEYDEGPMFIRWNSFTEAGEGTTLHDHEQIHWTDCRVGKALVSLVMPDGTLTEHVIGPEDFAIKVPAAAMHKITALEVPCLTHCRFLHRTLNGIVAERFCGNHSAFR